MKITKFAIKTMLLSASLIAGQLQAAAPIDPEIQPLGTIGPIELSNTDLRGNDSRAYRGWFENGSWQGDLIEYSVSDIGQLTTSVDLTGFSPAAGAGGNWSAHVQFAAATQDDDYWIDDRKVITSSENGSQIAFLWRKLSDVQKEEIEPGVNVNDTSNDILNYLRGDQSNEGPGQMRARLSILGDIVHSNPEYVGVPDGSFTDSSYVDFKNDRLTRAARVYVGANDGMLHAFDASNGNEVWAYVPSMLFPKLRNLTALEYYHRYYVDGGITVRDAKLDDDWATVLVGSLGAGARGLYVLDVTNPDLSDEQLDDGKFMYELEGDDIGYIFDPSTITQLNDGEWYAINGNGISSANGVAKLLLIDLETGTVRPITTDSGSTGSPNGLAAPALIDINGDNRADIAFAGDVNGDMWKFDLTGTDPDDWEKEYKLFDGTEAQPITTAPDVAHHPRGGYQVLFGTGKLYEADDVTNTTVQAIYGIWDKPEGSLSLASSPLLQEMTGDLTYDQGPAATVRTFNPVTALDFNSYNGWYIELPAGERLLTTPALRDGRFKGTVTDPDGFSNWLLEATFDEGSANNETIFDLNGDTFLNVDDRVYGNPDSDYTDLEDIPMAWKRPDGNMSQVTIGRIAGGFDTLFLNFLNPPLIESYEDPCTGSCIDGLEGGHMDVDTDGEYAGKTDGGGGKHMHEYDIANSRTFVDYFDIDPNNKNKPQAVTEIFDDKGYADNKEFIVLIANADWSAGAELQIGNVTYNVVEYQAMIHQALAAWDPEDDDDVLEDPAGNPLIHSLDTLTENGGTLRNTFKATVLVYGGLIPSKTGCVKGDVHKEKDGVLVHLVNDRWRNNALVMQLVDADYVKNVGAGKPLDRLRVQNPPDIFPKITLADGTIIRLTDDKNDNGVNGDSPEYEVYGGLTARDGDSFLYESTVFWHWNDRELEQPDLCYADTEEYRTAYKEFTTQVPVAMFLEQLEAATGLSTFEELTEHVAELKLCKDIDTSCEDKWEEIRDWVEMAETIGQVSVAGSDKIFSPGDGGSLSGDPQVVGGGISESGKTSGPNFQTGRRTWIDILTQ